MDTARIAGLMLSASMMGCQLASGQASIPDQQVAARAFAEFKAASRKENGRLWGRPLYGPLLLVKADTREVFANEPDSAGTLRAASETGVFVGVLPATQPLANTAIKWQSKWWTMMVWPLPTTEPDRTALAFHECFHRLQPVLGFTFNEEANNAHLDEEQGRVYLRLELEALRAALREPQAAARTAHTRNALLFRRYRYRLYPAAAANENKLELNEGLAEYSGLLAATTNLAQRAAYLSRKTDDFYQNPTFVRSFAYQTVPAYGVLLQLQQPTWHRGVRLDTNLTNLFSKEFGGTMTAPQELVVRQLSKQYGGPAIVQAEQQREAQRQQRLAEYRKKFLTSPGLVIRLLHMNISFDPRTMQPLDSAGTVYPTVKVSDDWGTLTADGGALLGKNWDKITVPVPLQATGQEIVGEGYRLILNLGWALEKVPNTSSYQLRKK